ncbi:MAG: TIM barrel protein, partial [Saprospiraceae bacterium]|nr:TIM barrel protein [Saprospiraceae bacterium]
MGMFLTHVFGKENPLEISCQQYPWQTFMERSGQNWYDDLSTSIELVKAAGFNRFEPLIESKEYLQDLMPLLKNLICPSIYVNSVLHTNQKKNESIAEVLEIARLCKPLGTEIVVTNPSPIQWGGMEDKSDGALMIQAEALDRLGRELRKLDMQLAYHNHDSEMRNSAREFHHMMLATDPHNVKLCLDAHWIYRGAGNSSVALFDI